MDEHGDVVQMLQPVFDSCDFNGDGFVKIEDLLQLGKQHAFENIDVRTTVTFNLEFIFITFPQDRYFDDVKLLTLGIQICLCFSG